MAHEPQSTDSIFDFLYVDTDRLKAWLAQLLEDGIPTGHKRTAQMSETDTSEVTGNVDVNAKASALIAKGEIKGAVGGRSASVEGSLSGIERSFDATWSLPLNALDLLDEGGLIERDISKATLGSIVLVSGTPRLFDIKLLQDVWKPAIGFMSAREKITHRNKAELMAQRTLFASIGELLQAMPPTPQLTMNTAANDLVWGCVKEEHMVIDASSLALTHGASVKGTWNVLAVLDAIPDADADGEIDSTQDGDLSQLMGAAANVLGSIRGLLGRPEKSYGITPVVIFRSIGARQ